MDPCWLIRHLALPIIMSRNVRNSSGTVWLASRVLCDWTLSQSWHWSIRAILDAAGNAYTRGYLVLFVYCVMDNTPTPQSCFFQLQYCPSHFPVDLWRRSLMVCHPFLVSSSCSPSCCCCCCCCCCFAGRMENSCRKDGNPSPADATTDFFHSPNFGNGTSDRAKVNCNMSPMLCEPAQLHALCCFKSTSY